MLSIVDLLQAGTFTVDLAAYALAAIGKGASFMVGALPGGAGKTTVMGALLNFVPAEVGLASADGEEAIAEGLARSAPRRCYICHEIGSGGCYAYLWGADLREYFRLPWAGHILASNLHADTYEQARAQVCADNSVDLIAFGRMNLIFFLNVGRTGAGVSRRIATIWESDGTSPHRRLCIDRGPIESRLVDPSEQSEAQGVIQSLLAAGRPEIEHVRRQILAARL